MTKRHDYKAMEELKLLQNVIGRQEDFRMKIKSWAVTLVSAVSIAFLSGKINISSKSYIIMSVGIIVSFCWTDVIYRVAQNRAMKRSGNVESYLRGEVEYSGPKIGSSLSIPNTLSEQFGAFNNVRTYSVYLILVILTLILSFCK